MPSVYDLKPRFQALLRPVSNGLAAAGVTANHVTIAAVVLSFGVGGLIAARPEATRLLLLLPLTLLVRMALNAIDGMLAREHGMKSNLGAILNELGDVLSDSALYLPLAWVAGFRAELVVVFALLAAVAEMTGVLGVQIGASRRYDGPMGKSDRALWVGALGLIAGAGARIGGWMDFVLGAMIALSMWTILNRARRALAEVRS